MSSPRAALPTDRGRHQADAAPRHSPLSANGVGERLGEDRQTGLESRGNARVLAERVGFEPTVRMTYNGFRDRPDRPLWHLSKPSGTGVYRDCARLPQRPSRSEAVRRTLISGHVGKPDQGGRGTTEYLSILSKTK